MVKCNEIEFDIMFSGSSDEKLLELENSETELYELVDLLPDPVHLNEIVLTCSADIFLEVLMGNIRNALISFQAWIQKCKQAKAAATTAQIIITMRRKFSD
jgi:hypothetical protein